MQLCEYNGSEPVERDMDLIRELLLQIAAFEGHSLAEVTYHVNLLFEAGLVDGEPRSELPMISRLTWKGHEVVDSIRDAGIWANVKERIKGLPGVTIAVVTELALAELKKKLKQ